MYKHFRENHKFRKIFNKNTVTPSQQKSKARAKEYLNKIDQRKRKNATAPKRKNAQ